jgi:sugar transferase (PEP-CTERM/EpsH1 system associated)
VRVLYLTHRLPYAPNRGDRVRAYHTLRLLAAHASVDLVSFVHSDEEEARARDLEGMADRVVTLRLPTLRNHVRAVPALAGTIPLTHVLLDTPLIERTLRTLTAEQPPDVVLAYCSGVARFALCDPLRRWPFALDMVDVDSGKWQELGRTAAPPWNWIYAREARHLARFEADAARQAAVSFVVNERERRLLESLAPGARVAVVPNGVELHAVMPAGPPSETPNVVFCGVMNYAPNELGALWLMRDVWPLVRQRRPDATLTLVGADPTRTIRSEAARDRSITVTGTVPDVKPYLWRAAVAAAPLAIARGVQNKVLEAVAAGLPAVVTPAVADGLPREVLPACGIGRDAPGFAAALLDRLNRSAVDRRHLAREADLSGLTWPLRLAPILPALEQAASMACPEPGRTVGVKVA